MSRRSVMRVLVPLLVLAVGTAWGWNVRLRDSFDHQKHAELFPTCTTCHQGAAETGLSMWPSAEGCATCHDGTVQDSVDWRPRDTPTPTNLQFDHAVHRDAQSTPPANRTAVTSCTNCHTPTDSTWMTVRRTISTQCLDCHTITGEHLAAPDSACATCHVPLAHAPTLTTERIAGFASPPSHAQPSFLGRGPGSHGQQAARAVGETGVSASCATCHAQNFCLNCHVDAPEQPTIQALAPDPRSLAIEATLVAPASHGRNSWAERHGREAERTATSCATCHTQESCLTCHVPPAAAAIQSQHRVGPGRAEGARTERVAPVTHTDRWVEGHGPIATASPTSCLTCHVRNDCLSCHRPDATRQAGFHPSDYLTRHPIQAYQRESTCADCHNTGQFCASCHRQAGLVATGALGTASYHDGKRFFIAGHGQAARQSLETCVGCHVERDCLTCHSAVGGRRFNPHGPGFDPERLRRKNPEMCVACHGTNIPRR